MPFETGAATDAADLLSKLHDFINAQTDWVIDEYDTAADELHVHDSGANGYWALKATQNMDTLSSHFLEEPGIAALMATGYDAGAAWDAQPNTTTWMRGVGGFVDTTVPAYWFFTDGADYVHVAARVHGTSYGHLHLGLLSQFGSWTGGAYLAGVYTGGDGFLREIGWLDTNGADADLRADIDGQTDFFLRGNDNALGALFQPDTNGTFSSGDFFRLFDQVNEWNSRAVFMPVHLKGQRQDDTNNWSYLGYPLDIRVVHARYINPESTVTIGADEWLVFPYFNRGDAEDTRQLIGFAYRKVS